MASPMDIQILESDSDMEDSMEENVLNNSNNDFPFPRFEKFFKINIKTKSGFKFLTYLGITGHWLDPRTLKRRSVALALKRIIGCQTYDVLANKIIDIHKSFRIHNKVCKMVTDNGSNYLKAFRIFGEDNAEDEIQNDSQHALEEEEIGVDANDINEILEEGSSTNSTMLPSHQRCSCHNLNLIATVDAEGALNDEDFKRVSRSTFYVKLYGISRTNLLKKNDVFRYLTLGFRISQFQTKKIDIGVSSNKLYMDNIMPRL
ncbi:uncharacterized protein LOC135926671 [Gordionus sp. m RMFG-2023]|uniref:uncharacterized protein LOC135926671 n=1 Tax=Gordionus sp. m RMFG-2023 TaxID=3053472 RepID=UPI0031FD4E0C